MTPFDRNKRFFFYFEQIGTVQQGLNGDSGTTDPPVDFAAKQHELQTIIEKQTSELSQWQRRVSDLNGRINELEDTLSKNTKDYGKAQDHCVKLQRDLRENVAQKEDQEERIATLEKRYLHAQRESTSLHDLNEKLEQELRHKEAQLKVLVFVVVVVVCMCARWCLTVYVSQLQDEKISAIQEKLELSDQKLAQCSKLPEIEEQLKARMEALTQVGNQVGRVEKMIDFYSASTQGQPYVRLSRPSMIPAIYV